MVYAQPRNGPKNEKHTFFLDFEILTDHLILARRLDQVIIKKELAVSADNRVKLKDSEK